MPTEDGWEPSPRIEPDSPLLVWRQVPGIDVEVTVQVRDDDAGTLMLAYLADFHKNVEPLRDADTACYTPTNSVSTSNHLNATAADTNWNSHPFQTRGTYTDVQMIALRKLLDFYPWMFWAGDWDSPIDEMHHQLNYGTYNKRPDLDAWIKQHIGPDGTSDYNDPTPTHVPVTTYTRDDAIKALYDAVPEFGMDDAARLLDPIVAGLTASYCNTTKRVAMWLAQVGEESGGFVYTQEIQPPPGAAYPPYIGRTWIQITWESNYAAFGQWAASQNLITDPNQFVNNPDSLADIQWAGIGPAWYWTVERPNINSLCDNSDIVGVTQAINGGQNGIDQRTARYNQAIALGDELLALINVGHIDPGGNVTAPTDPANPTQADWDDLVADVKEVRKQLGGDEGWPQLSTDKDAIAAIEAKRAAGTPLSLVDGVAWLMHHVSTHKNPTP